MNSPNFIPEDYLYYFIKNIVDLVDCSKTNRNFVESLVNLLILKD